MSGLFNVNVAESYKLATDLYWHSVSTTEHMNISASFYSKPFL